MEIDGSIHFVEGQPEKKEKRQGKLESLGITVIRFTESDVKSNLSWVLEELKKELGKLEDVGRK